MSDDIEPVYKLKRKHPVLGYAPAKILAWRIMNSDKLKNRRHNVIWLDTKSRWKTGALIATFTTDMEIPMKLEKEPWQRLCSFTWFGLGEGEMAHATKVPGGLTLLGCTHHGRSI